MKATALCIAAALLGACAAMNTSFRVHGVIKSARHCQLVVLNRDTNRKETWDIAGEFEETIVAGGPYAVRHDLTVLCDGRVMKTVNSVFPSYDNWKHPVELGTIEP